MAVATLKPHLAGAVYDDVFERLFGDSDFMNCFDGRSASGRYYNNSSDSGSDYLYDVDDSPRVYTYYRVSARYFLRFALQNKFAFRRFLYFIKTNFTLRFRKKQIYLHHSDPSATNCKGQALGAKHDHYFKKFLKYATKVSFYKVDLGTEAAVKCFLRRLKRLNGLRHIDMTGKHEISPEVLSKMANIFAKLTDFDVDPDTFVTILEKTTVSFPKLESLKLTGNMESLNKVVTTPERFPVLNAVKIVPANMAHDANELVFAENPFPTIKNFTFSIDEDAEDPFTVSDFELIKNWLNKLPTLKQAKISIRKWINEYPHDDPQREKRLHAAFQSVDFGGAYLDLTFYVEGDTPWPQEGELEDRFFCFDYNHHYEYATFIHEDCMVGKKFQHILILRLDY